METTSGILTSAGVPISEGIVIVSGIAVPFPVTSGGGSAENTALSSGVWSGSYQTLSVPVANTYYRLNKTSVTEGDLPDGITDNDDCSFTNDSGGELKVEFTLTAVMGRPSSNNACNLTLGDDSGGGDAVVLDGAAMWYPDDTTYLKSYTSKGTYVWADGVTIFPMYLNYNAAVDLSYGSSKQRFEIIG